MPCGSFVIKKSRRTDTRAGIHTGQPAGLFPHLRGGRRPSGRDLGRRLHGCRRDQRDRQPVGQGGQNGQGRRDPRPCGLPGRPADTQPMTPRRRGGGSRGRLVTWPVVQGRGDRRQSSARDGRGLPENGFCGPPRWPRSRSRPMPRARRGQSPGSPAGAISPWPGAWYGFSSGSITVPPSVWPRATNRSSPSI